MQEKIVLLTNEMTPYRKSFYDKIYQYCSLHNIKFSVLTMTKLQKGYNWNFDECMSSYVTLMKGFHIPYPVSMHINFEVVRQLKQLPPDILIMAGSYVNPTSWLALYALRKTPCKTYFWSESHLNEVRSYKTFTLKIRDWVRHQFYSKFTGFWFAGKLSKQFIDRYAKHTKEMYLVPNLIDDKCYYNKSKSLKENKDTLRKSWGLVGNKRIAIIPARLSKEKGILQFLEILNISELKNRVTVIIPGVGPLEETLKEKVKKLNLNVKFLGYQQQPKMIELYALADFLILPSLSDPNPLTSIEALWCGLPLYVSTHVGNYPEVVEDGVNGYVFEYKNQNDAVGKLNRLISASDEWYVNAARKSQEIANSKFNSEKVVPELINKMTNR